MTDTTSDGAGSGVGSGGEWERKLRTGLAHKAAGNAAFIAQDISAALASYHHALLYLTGLETRSVLDLMRPNPPSNHPDTSNTCKDDDSNPEGSGGSDGEEVGEVGRELAVVHANMSACYLKQQRYAKAISSAEKALRADPSNIKASFRKAQALRLSGDVYTAKTYIETTLASLTSSAGREATSSFEAELKMVRRMIEVKQAQARQGWKGFLNRNPNALHTDDVQAEPNHPQP